MTTSDQGNKKARPYYRNAEDTLEDVGITQRQLGYWRKQGLFTPELGSKSKNFTRSDTERLRFLKRLIDDLKLPIASVQHLLASSDPINEDVATSHALTYIDVETQQLVSASRALDALMANAIANEYDDDLEKWFRAIALGLFNLMMIRSKSSQMYKVQRQELFNLLETADLMARIDVREDRVVFWFSQEDDPELTKEQAEWLSAEAERLMSRIYEIRNQQLWEE